MDKETGNHPGIRPGACKGVNPDGDSKRLLAGLLALFMGFLGVHKFVLGYVREGVVQIVFTAITFGFGGLIGIVEGILYLIKTDKDFYRIYQAGKRSWF